MFETATTDALHAMPQSRPSLQRCWCIMTPRQWSSRCSTAWRSRWLNAATASTATTLPRFVALDPVLHEQACSHDPWLHDDHLLIGICCPVVTRLHGLGNFVSNSRKNVITQQCDAWDSSHDGVPEASFPEGGCKGLHSWTDTRIVQNTQRYGIGFGFAVFYVCHVCLQMLSDSLASRLSPRRKGITRCQFMVRWPDAVFEDRRATLGMCKRFG